MVYFLSLGDHNFVLFLFNFFLLFSDFKERKRERMRNIDLLFHLLMHSLVDSCMCPDLGLNS